ncbi:MAG: hypothetical protein MJ186_04020 [Clostridia bacterium]|nr:hypothetical protein [Clostridia bacterium]
MGNASENRSSTKNTVSNTIMFLLLTLVIVTAVSYAWFSINDRTNLNTMRMDITTGRTMRIDVDAHDDFELYVNVLQFETIAARIHRDRGVDITRVPIEPVTTADGRNFTFEDGKPASADNGTYLDFTLHFRAMGDMYVHLTSTSTPNTNNGTRIWSNSNPDLQKAMRMSFEMPDGRIFTYDPGETDISGITDGNMLFFLPKDTDIPVQVRIWIEGTDPECNNRLKGLDYSVQMRFEGSDENNNPLT